MAAPHCHHNHQCQDRDGSGGKNDSRRGPALPAAFKIRPAGNRPTFVSQNTGHQEGSFSRADTVRPLTDNRTTGVLGTA